MVFELKPEAFLNSSMISFVLLGIRYLLPILLPEVSILLPKLIEANFVDLVISGTIFCLFEAKMAEGGRFELPTPLS